MESSKDRKKIGILALQGNFDQHANLISHLGMDSVLIRGPGAIQKLDGLIIPGGESTTICHLLTDKLREEIHRFAANGKPILGTCAGLILLSSRLTGNENEKSTILPLSLLDIEVKRNAFGPQIHSNFKQIQIINCQSEEKEDISICHSSVVCFIRAPAITKLGQNVQILAKIDENGNKDELACAVQQKNVIGLCFHPEISQFDYFHRLAFFSFNK